MSGLCKPWLSTLDRAIDKVPFRELSWLNFHPGFGQRAAGGGRAGAVTILGTEAGTHRRATSR